MSSDVVSLPLVGDLTVRQAAALHARLIEALAGARHLMLDCAAAERVDLTFLQLVLAARANARAQGGDLTLSSPSSAVTEAACRAGLAGPGAVTAPEEHAFWHASETGAS